MSGDILNSPWVFVAENVQQDLLKAFQNLKNEMEHQKFEEVPILAARIGRTMFLRSPLSNLESFRRSSVTEATLGQMKRLFYTHLSSSYMDYVITQVVPKIGLLFDEENEFYLVKVSDKTQQDSFMLCKCSVSEEYKKLELNKIELIPVRYLCVDISCVGKNQDLRLMLSNKTILTLPDDDTNGIKSLISSAIIDPDVRGGLRWIDGKESVEDRYIVCEICHQKAKTYINSSFELKGRHTDRFDLRTSDGEVSSEISLRMTGLTSQLLEQSVEADLVIEMLKDNLKFIWESFLCYGSST